MSAIVVGHGDTLGESAGLLYIYALTLGSACTHVLRMPSIRTT